MTILTKISVMNAIPGSMGIQIKVARKLKVSRSAVSMFLANNPDCLERLKQEGEVRVDIAEEEIYHISEMGNDPKILPSKLKAIQSILSAKRKWAQTINQNVSGSMEVGSAEHLRKVWEDVNGSKPDSNSSSKK